MASSLDPLTALIRERGVALLDGGLATELERRGCDLDDPLWSARALLDAPEVVRSVHADYLRAGADVIVSATYQASFPGLARVGLDAGGAERLMLDAVRLALAARDEVAGELDDQRPRPLVAAGIGPYGAWLADGSEYRGDYDLDGSALARFHRARLALLARSGADLLALETIPSAPEARALCALLEETGARAWISFSCRDDERISDGTPLTDIGAEVAGCPQIAAVGVNCTPPERIEPLIAALKRVTHKPIAAYPNSGERWDARRRRWLPAADDARLAERAPAWIEAGATLLGGCCRTGPEDIRALRAAVPEQVGRERSA